MERYFDVSAAPKTSIFQMRINPDIKKCVETIYANFGMTLSDALDAFLQQSINMQGLPFPMEQDNKEILHEQAAARFMAELKKGEDSVKTDADWISEEDMFEEFGITL